MPTGPFGFPRVTDVGPLSDVEAEQEFIREESNTFIVGTDVDREVASIHRVDMDDVQDVKSKLVVRADLGDKPSNFREMFKRQVNIALRDEEVATMDYWYDPDNSVAKIFDIVVEEAFRQMGLATELKNRELDYMKEQGVEVVYTDIISEGGYRLAKRTGFKPIQQATHLRGEEAMLGFNAQTNRGIMFKYL